MNMRSSVSRLCVRAARLASASLAEIQALRCMRLDRLTTIHMPLCRMSIAMSMPGRVGEWGAGAVYPASSATPHNRPPPALPRKVVGTTR